MCGIAGSIGLGKKTTVKREILLKMSMAIADRGPDGEGLRIFEDECVGLVHRRLAIIDLSEAANQPMCNDNESIWIVYNGEIYNHEDIRNELNKTTDIKWRTDHSDTEVIIRSYEKWGIKCINRFRGMFAFVLWDRNVDKFYFVRDRVGIKPLYYGLLGNKINFASNVSALLEDNEQKREVDKTAVYDYISLLAVPAPKTLFKYIKKVKAGHYIEVSKDGIMKDVCYWEPSKFVNREPVKTNFGATKKKLLKELRCSTQLRKVSDVPVGVFLSGGVDSSTNLALFSENEKEVNTFTVGYKGTHYYKNENKYAKEMANYCNAIHHDEILGDEDIINFIGKLSSLCDDPVADPVIISQFFIAKLAIDNGIKVVQVGEGADELFAGYSYWNQQAMYERMNAILPRSLKKYVYKIACRNKNHNTYNMELLRRAAEDEGIFWGSGAVYINEERKKQLFSKSFLKEIGDHRTWDNFTEIYNKCKNRIITNTVGWMACVNFEFRLPELLLARTDKSSMAVGLEGRVPFLDHRLVEWGLRIPQNMKIRKGIHKFILKETVRGIVPDSVIDRKKVGFGLPYAEWYKGKLGSIMKEKVDSFVCESGYFEKKEASKFMNDNQNDPIGIWALFILALWWERYGRTNNCEEAMQ